jgi:hypothetical protein
VGTSQGIAAFVRLLRLDLLSWCWKNFENGCGVPGVNCVLGVGKQAQCGARGFPRNHDTATTGLKIVQDCGVIGLAQSGLDQGRRAILVVCIWREMPQFFDRQSREYICSFY